MAAELSIGAAGERGETMNRRRRSRHLIRGWQGRKRRPVSAERQSSSYPLESLEARLVLTSSPIELLELSGPSITEHMAIVAADQTYVTNELVVSFRTTESVTSIDEILAGSDGPAFYSEFTFSSIEPLFSLNEGADGELSLWHFTWSSDQDAIDYLDEFGSLNSAEWAAPNFIYESEMDFTPDDPDVGNQYHHTVMQNYSAWDTTTGSPNIIVAVTDSGFDWDHPDLDDNIWSNTDEIAGNGIDDDNNGYIDDIRGWDFVSNDNNPDESSTSSHGTHVAGIVGAEIDNATGVAGTAGDVTIMPLRIGSGPTSTRYAGAFTYAADNGAHIANTSFSVDSRVGDPVYRAALRYMYDGGVLHFNSAGNNDQLNPNRQNMHESLFVASTNSTDGRSGFTNYGIGIDVSAPGSSVLSTLPNGNYGTKSGTSMAAPNAAGVAALIWSANPTWTRDQVAAQLLGTADDIYALNPEYEGLLGSGRVNSNRALTETLAPPEIETVAELPSSGGVLTEPISTLTVELANIFDKTSIENISNWELRSDGADNIFGNSDDYIVPLTLQTEYLIGTNDLEFSIDGPLAQEHYRFRAISGGLTDPFGTALDGNGDSTAGDDFIVEFTVAAPEIEWELLEPFGSLVSTFTASDFLLAVPTGSGFTSNLIGGQTLSFEASPTSGSATLTVTVENSGGIIATATAGSAGGSVSLQDIVLPSTDDYTIRVTSDVDTDFDLELFRNATVELLDSADGSELAIDGSGLQLGSTRYAAVGTIDSGSDVDEYTVNLAAGPVDIVVAGIDGNDLSSATIELIDTDGTSVLVTATDQPLGVTAENYDQAVLGFAISSPGQYTIRVSSSATGSYGLVVTENIVFDSEPNDTGDPLRSLNDTFAAMGFLNSVPIDGNYVFTIDSLESSLSLSGNVSGEPFTEQAPGSLSSTISGTVRAGLTSSSIAFIGGSVIDVTETPGLFLPGNAPADFAAQVLFIYAAARDVNADVTSGQNAISSLGEFSVAGMNLELTDGTFAYEVPGVISDTLSIAGFSALNESTAAGLIEVLPGQLKLTVPIEATIMLEDPELGLEVNATLTGVAVGTVSLPASQDAADSYTLDLVEGQTVTITTETPFDTAAGSVLSNLDPTLTIYDPLSGIVGTDDNSAADGRNASITFTADSTGTYRIDVGAVSGAGTYVLDISAPPAATISGTTDIYRGETVTFTLNATDPSPVDQAGLFDFEIDWDGDGSVDETLLGVPDGTTVLHTFPTTFSGDVQVRATDQGGATGTFSQLPITVSPYVLRDDGLGNIDLIWGGTPGVDAVFVFGEATSMSLFVQFENSLPVNRFDFLGSAVTGNLILHGYGSADALIGEFAIGNVVEIYGGEGDDVIVGGFLGDILHGDAGNDVILGGTQATDGADQIFGGEDKDVLFGHWGADTLDGGAGEDLLMGDRYGFANLPDAVLTIGNEWTSGRPYAERVTNIRGITNTGVNNDVLVPNVTIADDGAEDLLIGGVGEIDWFLYDFDQDLLGDVIEVDEEETDTNP